MYLPRDREPTTPFILDRPGETRYHTHILQLVCDWSGPKAFTWNITVPTLSATRTDNLKCRVNIGMGVVRRSEVARHALRLPPIRVTLFFSFFFGSFYTPRQQALVVAETTVEHASLRSAPTLALTYSYLFRPPSIAAALGHSSLLAVTVSTQI